MSTIGLNFDNVHPGYRALIVSAVERMETVLTSHVFFECFLMEVAKSYYLCGERSKWKDKSADEIFAQIFPITLWIKQYNSFKNVVGYGYPNDKWIYLNTKFLDQRSVFDEESLMLVGSNLLHEHGHDQGFEHDFYDTPERKFSICYILNRAYERAYRIIYQLPEPVIKTYIPWYKRLWKRLF